MSIPSSCIFVTMGKGKCCVGGLTDWILLQRTISWCRPPKYYWFSIFWGRIEHLRKNWYIEGNLKKKASYAFTLRTLFWLWSGGTCHTYKWSPLKLNHLSHRGTHIPASNKLVTSVGSKEVTACFISVSVANCLPTRCFLRGPKMWRTLRSILQIDYVWEVMDRAP